MEFSIDAHYPSRAPSRRAPAPRRGGDDPLDKLERRIIFGREDGIARRARQVVHEGIGSAPSHHGG